MSDLQRRDQKSCSALIGYASPLLHMTPCDVVDVKVEFAIISQVILIFTIWLKISKLNEMIKFELTGSSGYVITQSEDCCHGCKISIATKTTLTSFCHE